MKHLHFLFSTWFGLGMIPKAPGTMGSLGTLPFVAIILWFSKEVPPVQVGILEFNLLFPLSVLLFFAAVPSVKWMIFHSGRKDPQTVVIDEVVGQSMAFAFLSPPLLLGRPWLFLLGFAFFRLFDIYKILGIRKLEALPGAWGVLADDLLGGVYAGLLLRAVVTFFP